MFGTRQKLALLNDHQAVLSPAGYGPCRSGKPQQKRQSPCILNFRFMRIQNSKHPPYNLSLRFGTLSNSLVPFHVWHCIFWGCVMDSEGVVKEPLSSRKDIVDTESRDLSVNIAKAVRTDAGFVPPAGRSKRRARAKSDNRIEIRKKTLESP